MPAPQSHFFDAIALCLGETKQDALDYLRTLLKDHSKELGRCRVITEDGIAQATFADADPVRYDEIDEIEQVKQIKRKGDIRIVPVMIPKRQLDSRLPHFINEDGPRFRIKGSTTVTVKELRLLDSHNDRDLKARNELRAELSQAILDDRAGENTEAVLYQGFRPPENGTLEAFDPNMFAFASSHETPTECKVMTRVEEVEMFTVISKNKVIGKYETEEEANEAAERDIRFSSGFDNVSILRSVEVSNSQFPDEAVIDLEVSVQPKLADEELVPGFFIYTK